MEPEQDILDNNKSESEIGFIITGLYLLIVLSISILFAVGENGNYLTLNNLGDFLAGLFAPVAFLWLVLGYRQQGMELRQQARELAKTAKELKKQNELLQQEQNLLTPRFDLQELFQTGYSDGDLSQQESVSFEFSVINTGGDAVSLTAQISTKPLKTVGRLERETILFGETLLHKQFVPFENYSPGHIFITISGQDRLHRYFRYDFKTKIDDFTPFDRGGTSIFPTRSVKIINYVPESPIAYDHSYEEDVIDLA